MKWKHCLLFFGEELRVLDEANRVYCIEVEDGDDKKLKVSLQVCISRLLMPVIARRSVCLSE